MPYSSAWSCRWTRTIEAERAQDLQGAVGRSGRWAGRSSGYVPPGTAANLFGVKLLQVAG